MGETTERIAVVNDRRITEGEGRQGGQAMSGTA